MQGYYYDNMRVKSIEYLFEFFNPSIIITFGAPLKFPNVTSKIIYKIILIHTS